MVDFFHGPLVQVGCRRNFIDGSEKRNNCKLGFELQSSRVIERRCKSLILSEVSAVSSPHPPEGPSDYHSSYRTDVSFSHVNMFIIKRLIY